MSDSRSETELMREISPLRERIQELERSGAGQNRLIGELEFSRRQLRMLIEAGPDLFFLKDLDLSYRLINSALARFFGRDEAEILGRTDIELMPRAAAAACLESDRQAIREKRTVVTIEPVGDRIYETYKFPVMDADKIVGVAGIIRDVTERKRAEETLKEEAVRRRILVEQSRDGIVVLDENGKVYEANPRYADQLGYAMDEVMGLHVWDWDAQWTREQLQEMIRSVDEKGDHFETRHRRKDGTLYDVEISTNGAVCGGRKLIFCVCRDITERKQAQKALQENDERFNRLAEQTRTFTWEVDALGLYTYVSPVVGIVLGYRPDEIIGRMHFYDLHPEAGREEFKKAAFAVFARQEPFLNLENAAQTRDGRPVWLSTNGIPLLNTDGTLRGYDGSDTEITSRRQAEDALRKSEEMLRLITDNTSDMIRVADLRGINLYASPSHFRGLGYRPEERVRRSGLDLVHPDDLERVVSSFTAVVSGRQSLKVEYRAKHADGRYVWLETIADLLRDGQGNPTAMVMSSRDITDRKQAEEERKALEAQLLQARKLEAIGTLAGGVAHDFNNILMGIQGYASLMMLDLDPNHPHQESLGHIEEQVRSASDLTRQLLGFARGGRYETRPTDLGEIVRKSSAMFGRTTKELTIHRKYEKDLWPVEVDRGQIEQVLLNLYVNARHAMPSGGDIYLETRNVVLDRNDAALHTVPAGNYVRISVVDTGTGMEEETKKRIFDPFFTTREMGRGAGLGLAVVYGIMKGHGGFVDVNSTPGQGTTFTLFFPVSEKKAVEEKPAAAKTLRGTEAILLVDDEPAVLTVSEEILKALGYTVHAKGSGREAIDFFRKMKGGIDLIILDMIMPGLSGSETFDSIREIDPSIKVILSSGYSLEGQAQQIMDRGCCGFIQKPFNLAALSGKVREVLEGGVWVNAGDGYESR